MPITIDRSEFPMIVVRYREAPSVSEFEKYLGELSELYRGGRAFGLVFDATDAEAPPAVHRRLQAEFLQKHESLIRTHNMGTAFVITSMLQRGALTAILWLQPLPCPHYVCAEVSDARRWVRGRLDAARQPTAW